MTGGLKKPVVLIAGPTASGKSVVALELARRHHGLIVNADALQVYRELRILSARPSEEDERQVPHRLYGAISAAESYSVGRWLPQACAAIEEAWLQGRLPIVTGGTGLYFKALEEGLAPLPAIPAPIRESWRRRLAQEGAEALHRELAWHDESEAMRVRPSDGQRIVRALEVLQSTGRPLAEWHEATGRGFLQSASVLRLYLSPPRRSLYAAIDERFSRMIAAGALSEVKALLAVGLDPDLPAMKATGVRELARFLDGSATIEEACRIAKQESRRYAKRQLTWARRHMIAWKWLNEQYSERTLAEFFNFIRVTG
jgi:tRNA dimethylallyltransferase